MKKKIYILTYLYLFIYFGCTQKEKEKVYKAKYVIDINNPINIKIDELIIDIDTIRLEVTDESIMKNIDITHIMDDRLYILTNDFSAIHIFDLSGKYISKIKDVGNGPKEYIQITNMQIDLVKKKIIITDNFSSRILVYDKDGKQTDVFSLNFWPISIAPYKDGYIHSGAGKDYYKNPERDNYHIHFLDSNGLFISSAIEKENKNKVTINSPHGIEILKNGDILYQPPLSYVVYKICDHGIIPYYELNSRSKYKLMNDEEVKSFEYIWGKSNTLEEKENQGYLLTWGAVFDMEEYTLFHFKGGWNIFRFLYYNKKNHKTYFIDPMTVKDDQLMFKFFFNDLCTVDNDRIYIAPSEYILNEIKGNINIHDKKITKFINNTNFDSNPLLISYKLKFPK